VWAIAGYVIGFLFALVFAVGITVAANLSAGPAFLVGLASGILWPFVFAAGGAAIGGRYGR
jgi:hypothetical protein